MMRFAALIYSLKLIFAHYNIVNIFIVALQM